jgi:two-component system repressor protein LuxO
MNKKEKILMVEDSQSLAAIYASYLSSQHVDLLIVDNLQTAREEWIRTQPDLVLLDVELPDGNGLDLLKDRPREENEADVVVMTAYGSAEASVDAMNLGAVDYLSKPFDADRLKVTVTNTLKNRALQEAVKKYSSLDRKRYCDFIGKSLPMQSVYRIIDSVAPSNATAFIVGESGTGKELTASALHEVSKRKNEAFYAVNCAAIPRDLMESELFGHVRGAFTGATTHRDGAASMSDGGTLFLDEVCEMDLELQKKMLRFIQTGEYQRVGSNKVERADIRFVCASNKDPLVEVREGRFREDLFYRLHVVPIHLPPLRERGEDIIDIAEYFLNYYATRDGKSFSMISDSARSKMLTHQWPGNVRELQNAIQKAVVLNEGNYLRGHMLQLEQLPVMRNRLVLETDTQEASSGVTVPFSTRMEVEPLWIVERNTIERAIEICSGNVNKAASLLEVAPSTIYRKLQAWEAKDNSNAGHSCTA